VGGEGGGAGAAAGTNLTSCLRTQGAPGSTSTLSQTQAKLEPRPGQFPRDEVFHPPALSPPPKKNTHARTLGRAPRTRGGQTIVFSGRVSEHIGPCFPRQVVLQGCRKTKWRFFTQGPATKPETKTTMVYEPTDLPTRGRKKPNRKGRAHGSASAPRVAVLETLIAQS
jgi:hypothetical protein